MGSSTGEILYMFTKRYFVMLVVCFVLAVPFGWWIGHDLAGKLLRQDAYPCLGICGLLPAGQSHYGTDSDIPVLEECQ